MKFRLASDFYKVLALFSQAGCPFTQAGSLAAQSQMTRPLTASSVVAPVNTACQSRGTLRSAPSTAGSDQRTLVPSLDASIHSSSRRSTSSSSTWKSDSGALTYSTSAYKTSSALAPSEKPRVSSYFSQSNGSTAIPNPVFCQHAQSISAQREAAVKPFLPSASDPVAAATSTAPSSGQSTSWPTFEPMAARSSTAPTFESQRLSQMLPPKRELPFKVSRTTSENSRKAPKSAQAHPNGKTGTSDNQATNDVAPTAQANRLTDQGLSGAPKKGAGIGATKAIRTARNNAAAPRSRKKSSVFEGDLPVPAVQDLLRRSQRLSEKETGIRPLEHDAAKVSVPSIPSTATVYGHDLEDEAPTEAFTMINRPPKQPEERLTAYKYSNIDTQALLARVDERQQQHKAKRKDATGNHENSIPPPASKRIATEALLDRAALLPGGDGAQLLQVAISEAATGRLGIRNSGLGDISSLHKVSSTNAVHDHDWQENDGIPPSAQKPVEEISARSIDGGNSRQPERQPLVDISNAAQPGRSHTLASSSMMALMDDPNFAESPEITPWAGLPPEERDAALETWMCQQLESESFPTLVKTLEGMWQRIYFGR